MPTVEEQGAHNSEAAKFSDKILTNHAQIATQRVLYYNKPGFF